MLNVVNDVKYPQTTAIIYVDCHLFLYSENSVIKVSTNANEFGLILQKVDIPECSGFANHSFASLNGVLYLNNGEFLHKFDLDSYICLSFLFISCRLKLLESVPRIPGCIFSTTNSLYSLTDVLTRYNSNWEKVATIYLSRVMRLPPSTVNLNKASKDNLSFYSLLSWGQNDFSQLGFGSCMI